MGNLKRTAYLQSLKIKLLEEELKSRGIPLPDIPGELKVTTEQENTETDVESSDRHQI
jgi:predicted HTH domain antitoxin